jgi:glycosyltransferase involved in cell wall biosynthesis
MFCFFGKPVIGRHLKKLVGSTPFFYDSAMNFSGKEQRCDLVYVAGKDPLAEVSGGHSSYVRAHARAACRAGFRPRMFCLGARNDVVETDYGAVHRIRSAISRTLNISFENSIHGPQYPFHRKSLVKGVAQWLERRDNPVIIHGFGIWAEAGVTAAKLNRRTEKAHLITSLYTMIKREYSSKMQGAKNYSFSRRLLYLSHLAVCRFYLAKIERRAFNGSDLVLVNYQRVKSLLEEEYRHARNCRIVPYCSEKAFTGDQSAASPLPGLPPPLVPGKPLIVCVSRHDPRKGLDVLCEALAGMKRNGFRFNAVLIGLGRLREDTCRRIRSLRLSDCVSCPGYVEDIGPWLQNCDIYVLPSREEQSGSVSLLEAMQAGSCCVASGIDGMLEDIRDGEDGVLVPPGDVTALSNTLADLLRRPEKRTELGKNARETYERKFSAETLVSTLAGIYGEYSG